MLYTISMSFVQNRGIIHFCGINIAFRQSKMPWVCPVCVYHKGEHSHVEYVKYISIASSVDITSEYSTFYGQKTEKKQ